MEMLLLSPPLTADKIPPSKPLTLEEYFARPLKPADVPHIQRLIQEKQEAETRKQQEIYQRLRAEMGFWGYWLSEVRGFQFHVKGILKSVWQRNAHIELKVFKPRFLYSPRWRKFWIFLQEDILHPIRWKYSVSYQLLVFQQASEKLQIFGHSSLACPHAEAMQAMWDKIYGNMRTACLAGKDRLADRYIDHAEEFGKTLAVLQQWQKIHLNTEGALGGVQ